MSDDLDDLIRGAMKTLDEQVPSGYFEALPNQTLARLEGSSMQHGSSGTTDTNARDAMVPPPVDAVVQAKQTDEDSGLHDIRNLAQSTKQRLSSRRITNSPIGKDDDVLASSSGSFRNIALPQPAAMVSLPELTELPSKQEVIAADKKAAKAAKAEAKAEKKAAAAAVAIEEAAAVVPKREAFSLPSQQNKKSKAPLFAVLGLGVAAAAGGVIYMQTQKSEQKPAAVAQAEQAPAITQEKAAAPTPTVAPIEPPQKTEEELKAEAELEKAKADALAAEQAAAAAGAAEQKVAEAPKTATKAAAPQREQKKGKIEAKPEKIVETTKPADKKKPTPDGAKSANTGEGEPSFDALLKEAGVDEKKEKKPVLEKKSLTADDFKKGMAAITEKAQACYSGTQGTATVKLTIAPNGSVSKVTVGGAFAGKPEAACVSAAVKGASFPPWDGGPQSFTYAYMLSD